MNEAQLIAESAIAYALLVPQLEARKLKLARWVKPRLVKYASRLGIHELLSRTVAELYVCNKAFLATCVAHVELERKFECVRILSEHDVDIDRLYQIIVAHDAT